MLIIKYITDCCILQTVKLTQFGIWIFTMRYEGECSVGSREGSGVSLDPPSPSRLNISETKLFHFHGYIGIMRYNQPRELYTFIYYTPQNN